MKGAACVWKRSEDPTRLGGSRSRLSKRFISDADSENKEKGRSINGRFQVSDHCGHLELSPSGEPGFQCGLLRHIGPSTSHSLKATRPGLVISWHF